MQLRNHLEYLYLHILSIVTLSQLTGIFSKRSNFDLRRLLEGTNPSFRYLIKTLQCSLPILGNSLEVLRLEGGTRAEMGKLLAPPKKVEVRLSPSLALLTHDVAGFTLRRPPAPLPTRHSPATQVAFDPPFRPAPPAQHGPVQHRVPGARRRVVSPHLSAGIQQPGVPLGLCSLLRTGGRRGRAGRRQRHRAGSRERGQGLVPRAPGTLQVDRAETRLDGHPRATVRQARVRKRRQVPFNSEECGGRAVWPRRVLGGGSGADWTPSLFLQEQAAGTSHRPRLGWGLHRR